MNDRFNLQRFLDAQEPVAYRVTAELTSGRKTSHWMWFVFPQVKGLGRSSTAERFAIGSLAEAEAYHDHPVLGRRLREWTEIVVGLDGVSAEDIFGFPDYLKFRSSMTLFSRVENADPTFGKALEKYYRGKPDAKTLSILGTL